MTKTMPVNAFDRYPMTWKPSRQMLGTGPVYLALAAALERDVLSGALPPGTKLPPQRELADFLDLNFTTVTRAYDLCRDKNLVYGVTGRGTFVAPLPGVEETDTDDAVIDLGAVQAFPKIGGRAIVAAAQNVLARDSATRLFSYADRDGKERHRVAGQHWLARCGVDAPVARIAVFPGVQSALSTALLSVFGVGETLATDVFTYANLIHLARLAHVKLVPVAGDDAGMCPDALAEAVKRHRLRGVFLMPNCANPTTRTLTETRKDALAETIAAANLLLIEDDATLAAPSRTRRPLQTRIPERTLYLSGTTRLVSPGLRATYATFPSALRERLLAGFHHTAIKASALEAEILGELVLTGMAEKILREKAAFARTANRLFNRIFRPGGTGDPLRLFRTIPLPGTAGEGPEIERRCRAAGVSVCHSDRFAVQNGRTDAFLRVSLSSAASMARLGEGLQTLARRIRAGTISASS